MSKNIPLQNKDVIKLLSRLGEIRSVYPPELITPRREAFLGMAAHLAATSMAVGAGKNQIVSTPAPEPMPLTIKILLGGLITGIIALSAYIYSMIDDNRDRFMEFLTRATTYIEYSSPPDFSLTSVDAWTKETTETATHTITPVLITPQKTPDPNQDELPKGESTPLPEETKPGKRLGHTETPPGKR